MDIIRKYITSGRIENHEKASFIPQGAIESRLNLDIITAAVGECEIRSDQVGEVASCIIAGAQRVFTILVVIRQANFIIDFMKHDHYQMLDPKLPFSSEFLKSILPEQTALDFFRYQWEFCAPVYTKRIVCRSLEDRNVLPIMLERRIGRGGFGDVYKIIVHPDHCDLGNEGGEYVRKVFTSPDLHEQDFEVELQNLSILSHVKHPNIVELLGAYVYRGNHNLLFPLAEGGPLSELFKGDRPPELVSNLSVFAALGGLASAIEQVHDLTETTLNLDLIGCHHDLKPSNILVQHETFLLADFGLSRFKDSAETSSTDHGTAEGDYIAPECEELEYPFHKYRIRRSSDIWSFGCIILETLTYMLFGAEGIKNFRQRRHFKVRQHHFYTFHQGIGIDSKPVTDQLSDLSKVADPVEDGLVQYLRTMLSTEPKNRPRIRQVKQYLNMLTIAKMSQPIYKMLEDVQKASSFSTVFIEAKRFASWRWVCGLPDFKRSALDVCSDLSFFDEIASLREDLHMIHCELDAALNLVNRKRDWNPTRLRRLNSRLIGRLPASLRQHWQTHFDCAMVQTQDRETLAQNRLGLLDNHQLTNTALLASIKHMKLLADERSERSQHKFQVDLDDFERSERLGAIDTGVIPSLGQPLVLVEYLDYDTSWTEEAIGEKRLIRVEALVELLHQIEKPEGFRALRCLGYFHDVTSSQFGLVFECPIINVVPALDQRSPKVTTLSNLLEQTAAWDHLPALESKFRIACILASTILEFHKIGWMHRRICAAHFVLFSPPTENLKTCLDYPYVIGFSAAREDKPNPFTDGPFALATEVLYQHSDYANNLSTFHQSYDYYSFGLVLLEIGLWQPLYRWQGSEGEALQDFQSRLLHDQVPRLKATMGSTYFNVVRQCLDGSFGLTRPSSDSPEYKAALTLRFDEEVVRPLSRCLV